MFFLCRSNFHTSLVLVLTLFHAYIVISILLKTLYIIMMIYKIIKSFAAHNCQVAFTKLSIPCPFYSVLNINGWAEMVSIDFRKFNFSLSSIHVLYLEYCCSHYYLWRRTSTVSNGSIWKWCSFKNPFYVAWWQSGVEQSC